MLSKYAAMAQREQVEMLSMNCELITANNQSRRWQQLVRRTRTSFSGLLTTSPNGHGHAAWVEWYDILDVVGVDLYDHIAGSTLQEMVQSWTPFLDHLEGLSRRFGGKPVVLTEIGYCSGHGGGCNRRGDATNTSRAEQALHYEALLMASSTRGDWFRGAFFWNWVADPALGYDGTDACLSPVWKPAEDVLRKYYRATASRPVLPTDMRRQQCVCTY